MVENYSSAIKKWTPGIDGEIIDMEYHGGFIGIKAKSANCTLEVRMPNETDWEQIGDTILEGKTIMYDRMAIGKYRITGGTNVFCYGG